jgi:hypothetical protein
MATLFDALVFSADDLARQTYSDTIQAIGFLELADFSPSLDQSRATAKEPGHPHGRLLRIDANASEWSATEPAPGAAPLPYRHCACGEAAVPSEQWSCSGCKRMARPGEVKLCK